jgi:hypothetical protein
METLSFTLGVLAVIDLLIVAGTFLVLKTLNITRKQAESTQRELDANVRELHYEVERYRNDLYDEINTDQLACSVTKSSMFFEFKETFSPYAFN